MMAELNRIGVNYNKRMVRKKRRIDKALGRFELFQYLKVTEKEVDRKCKRRGKNEIDGSPSSQSQQNYQYG